MSLTREWGWPCLAALIIGVLAWAAITWIEMTLWNWIVAAHFGGPRVSFWLMAGIGLLIGLLTAGGRSAAR